MFSDHHLENLRKFVSDNIAIITAIGVFGALMSYLTINKESLPFGSFLPFISIILFLFFVAIFIRLIHKLNDDKKGDYIFFLQFLLIAFSVVLVGHTISAYTTIIEGIIKVAVGIGTFFFAGKLYEKYEKQLEKHYITTFLASILILFVFTKIDECNLLRLDSEGLLSIIFGISMVSIFLFLFLAPLFKIISKLRLRITQNLEKIISYIIIILVILIILIVILVVIDRIIRFEILETIMQFYISIKDGLKDMLIGKWCQELPQ